MLQRAQEQMEAAQKRVVFVETGKDRIRTTVFDVLYDHTNECQFLRRVKAIREGSFRVVDENGKIVTEGGCHCCTHLNWESTEYVPRTRAWELHGRYLRFNKDPDPGYPALIENDYWCGVETKWLGDIHRKSIVEGCDVPVIPWPKPAD